MISYRIYVVFFASMGRRFAPILVLGLCLSACSQWADYSKSDAGALLAEVGPKKLYMDDITSMMADTMSKNDSINFILGMSQSWVKDQLIIQEAEDNMPDDLNIDALVDEYRSSLLLYHYESQLVDKGLDTTVTKEQKRDHYEKNSEQYILPEAIVKYAIAKFPKTPSNNARIWNAWTDNDWPEVQRYAAGKATLIKRVDEWRPINDLLAFLPPNSLSKSDQKKGFDTKFEKDGNYYYVKIMDYANEGSNPPFEYVEGKITKVILNNRKKILLQTKKQQLFDQNIGSRSVKIHFAPTTE